MPTKNHLRRVCILADRAQSDIEIEVLRWVRFICFRFRLMVSPGSEDSTAYGGPNPMHVGIYGPGKDEKTHRN